jgi:hypothetical protein
MSPYVFISSLLIIALSLGYTHDEGVINSIILRLKFSIWVFIPAAAITLIIMIRDKPSVTHCAGASFCALLFYLLIADRLANQSDLTNFFSVALCLLSVVLPAITACIKPKVS